MQTYQLKKDQIRKSNFLLVLLFVLSGFYSLQAQEIDEAWFKANYKKVEQYIPMRDGVKLFTSFYIPKDSTTKHPILMTRTPYSAAPYGENQYRAFWNNHYREYLRNGYIMVVQDVRGRYMSEGNFVDVRPFQPNKKGKEIDEASDTWDTAEWMTKNLKTFNGKIGVFGISYPGFYSSMAAAAGHPAIKAVSPQAPVTDWFMGDDFHHNGAFFPMDGFSFYSSFGKPRPQPTPTSAPGFNFPIKDNYKFYLEAGNLKTLANLLGDSIKFWQEMYAHPNYDEWWQQRDARRAMKNLKPALLVVGGLFDAEDCFGAWELYKAIERQNPGISNKIVMGPWYHGQWARGNGSSLGNVRFATKTSEWYANEIEIPFFHYHLLGKGPEPSLAEATIFYTGENNWKKHQTWPPAGTVNRPIYLQEKGLLSFTAPSAPNGASTYTSDPNKPVPYTEDVHFRRTREYMTDDQRFASRRPDVLVFQTPPLEQDITLSGPVLSKLMVSISGTDADFVVKLIDVFPDDFSYPKEWPTELNAPLNYPMDGYQMLVRGEIMRGKFRNSFEKPEAFVPNQPTEVSFSLPDVAHTFKKGHRIMIQIQSTWFPLADRNPGKFMNIFEAEPEDFQPIQITIHHSASLPSQILLPISGQ